jgi:predicted DNA-binding protein
MLYSSKGDVMIAIRTKPEEEQLIKTYAELQGKPVSEVIRTAILEKIEDDFDTSLADEAYREFLADNKTYSPNEAAALLGL